MPVSDERDQFEPDQLELNVAEYSDLRAFMDGQGNYYPWPF